MENKNVFISHYNEDDEHVQRLKARLLEKGYVIKNSSIDSTKPNRVISDKAIERLLRMRMRWAGIFICLIGPDTHTRYWVNHEIEQAHILGKRIIGIYIHGSKEDTELPANYKLYGGPLFGWNSTDKIIDALEGENPEWEKPDSTPSVPVHAPVKKAKCAA